MDVLIKKITNKPIDSNCFVICFPKNSNSCIIVDPGTEDCSELIKFINRKNLIPGYLILTHEHFDHIWGVNKLKKLYECKVICSKSCSEKIINRKKNMSVFYDQVGFELNNAELVIEDINYCLKWNGLNISFIKTPGHTDSSICFYIDNNLFTGDTIIKGLKTVVKLPTGNKEDLFETIEKLKKQFINKQIIIHAGHGESFNFDEIKHQEL